MAEGQWRTASGAVDSGLIPRVGSNPMTSKYACAVAHLHSFSACCLAVKEQCGEQTGKFLVPFVKALNGISPSQRGVQMAGNY